MLVDLDALSIAQFHDAKLTDPAWPNAASSHGLEGAWRWIDANHRFNGLLWNEEDRARRTDVEPSEVAASKRLIDRHNQLRNDAVEAIDEVILQMRCNVMRSPGARLSSETAGAMIDRLSILALKIFHMREQTRRTDAGADHIDACTTKLRRLAMQRADLASCLDQLLADARVGLAHFKVYRQFKMYNDPALNPYLYARHASTAPDKAAPCIDILIPTCNRPCALAVVLTALSAQNFERFRIVVSDQSDEEGMFSTPEVVAIMRILRAHGVPVLTLRNMPRRGMAEQRAFLLANATAPYCLFLDDDVIIENDLLQRLYDAIREQQCGFVGSALHGLSYGAEQRPHEQHIEFWDGRVTPEELAPGCSAWARHHLHNAANLFHVQSRLNLTRDTTRHYRVAWVGGCVLFDAAKLREAGGFSFWHELPSKHCGEDVLAQVRVMAKFGGCGIIPSGAYHMELPTTIVARQFDAPTMLHPAGSG